MWSLGRRLRTSRAAAFFNESRIVCASTVSNIRYCSEDIRRALRTTVNALSQKIEKVHCGWSSTDEIRMGVNANAKLPGYNSILKTKVDQIKITKCGFNRMQLVRSIHPTLSARVSDID